MKTIETGNLVLDEKLYALELENQISDLKIQLYISNKNIEKLNKELDSCDQAIDHYCELIDEKEEYIDIVERALDESSIEFERIENINIALVEALNDLGVEVEIVEVDEEDEIRDEEECSCACKCNTFH